MVAQSKEPFCRLTRNVPACDFPDKTMAAIGISNCIDNICFIAENRLGEVTDSMVMSGYNLCLLSALTLMSWQNMTPVESRGSAS